ncbi:putative lipoprotein [Flavobacterium daejeonense]|nr:putative lipoprotein [Flavobacterium daejeonense]
MNINKSIIKRSFGILLISLAFIGCQDMERPELGDYPTDVGNYTPLDGETLFAEFNNTYYLNSINGAPATKVGNSSLGDPKVGEYSFMGATDSYITYPVKGLFGTNELTVAFWYKVNAAPDRSGLVVVGNPSITGDDGRKYGFRLFREGNGSSQTIKLNAGIGTGESWNDGGVLTVDNNWVYITLTISATESKIYFNGVLQRTSTFSSPVNFTGCVDFLIGSGGPTFSYWGHKSDNSLYDEIKVFNKVLTQTEIVSLMN